MGKKCAVSFYKEQVSKTFMRCDNNLFPPYVSVSILSIYMQLKFSVVYLFHYFFTGLFGKLLGASFF